MFIKARFSRMVLPVLLMVLLVGFGAGMAVAGQSDKAEKGAEIPIDRTISRTHEEVTGMTAEQSPGDFLKNAEGQPETERPEYDIEEVELLEDPDAPNAQFFLRIAGSNFGPRDSDTTFSYGGAGCLQRDASGGDIWFTHDLQLPDGAIIDYMRVFYYDSAAWDVYSELYAFDGAGGFSLLAEVDSSGTPGYGSNGIGGFSHTVDNVNESLVLIGGLPGAVGSSLRFCGIRIRYQYTLLSANFLPAVLNVNGP